MKEIVAVKPDYASPVLFGADAAMTLMLIDCELHLSREDMYQICEKLERPDQKEVVKNLPVIYYADDNGNPLYKSGGMLRPDQRINKEWN